MRWILQICHQKIAIVRGCVIVFGSLVRTEVTTGHDSAAVVARCAHGARKNKETKHSVITFLVIIRFSEVGHVDKTSVIRIHICVNDGSEYFFGE